MNANVSAPNHQPSQAKKKKKAKAKGKAAVSVTVNDKDEFGYALDSQPLE